MSEYNTGGEPGDRGVSGLKTSFQNLDVIFLQKVTGYCSRGPIPYVIHLKSRYQIRAVLDFPEFEEDAKNPMSSQKTLPIAIYYEQPNWFKPLFAELDRRGTNYVKLDAVEHRDRKSVV